MVFCSLSLREKIFDGSSSGNTTEGKTANIKWTILQNKYTSDIYDETSLSVTNNGTFSSSCYKGVNSPANIVKVIITYDNIEYVAVCVNEGIGQGALYRADIKWKLQ